MPTHYEVLGLPEGAPAAEVRRAYRRLAKAAHPDVAGDGARFRMITQAYDVLSDPDRRAAYDRALRAAPVAARPRRPRYGRYVAPTVAALAVAGVVLLVVATTWRSVGDDCLVGSWRGEAFEVPFRGAVDGREIAVTVRGGAGVRLEVAGDGTVRADHAQAEPLVGADGFDRIEGHYAGMVVEHWRAARGRVRQSGTDASRLTFRATINGRAPDRPVELTVVDREYEYRCTPTTLEVGPYRYARAGS